MATLILKRGSASRPSGQWREDDYDMLDDGIVVGRIFKVPVAPPDRPWMWASGAQAKTQSLAWIDAPFMKAMTSCEVPLL
jgi:hypothetical protein